MQNLDLQFDTCAKTLESKGYALLLMSDELTSIISKAFTTARIALDSASATSDDLNCKVPIIDPESNSGGWTGYHCANSKNGRYNKHREGFVFSNGEMFDVNISTGVNDINVTSFASEMDGLFHVMHNIIANGVLSAIEKRLKLPEMYFRDELGPTDKASQWHMKRYSIQTDGDSLEDECEILPMHTDPSLISVVILDKLGIESGGMGLQVLENSVWREIEQHGHGVAIIFSGSVLNHLLRDQKRMFFPSAKHRVVRWWQRGQFNQRMAATLFVRPNGDAVMKPLPIRDAEGSNQNTKQYQTFSRWNKRVARNYMKKKTQKR